MPEIAQVTPADGLTPDLVQGVEAKMDMPRPDFGQTPETPQQAKERMAEQVRRLIMYIGQEWGENSLEDCVRGLDDEKVIAFAERYRENLPFEVLAFLHNTRKRVNGLMPTLPEDSDIYMEKWIESYMEAHGLEKEDVVAQGRDAVMGVLAVAFNRNGDLTDAERKGVRTMAQNINDEKIIQNVMDYAAGHSYVVMCLLKNPNFDLSHIHQLVEKVGESYKRGEKVEECGDILIEVAGHMARSLHDLVVGRNSEGGFVLVDNDDLALAQKITRRLEQVDVTEIFIPQISLALDALKDPKAKEKYLEDYSGSERGNKTDNEEPVVTFSSNGRGNGDRRKKIAEQNAARKAKAKKKKSVFSPTRRGNGNPSKNNDKPKGVNGDKPGSVSKGKYKSTRKK